MNTRTMLGALVMTIVAGCTDTPQQPLDPTPDDPDVSIHSGMDATERMIKAIQDELAESALLKLNAELAGQTVAERRSAALKAIEELEQQVERYEAMASASAAPCDPDARFLVLWTQVSYIPPMWEGSWFGEYMRIISYTSVKGPAMLESSMSAYHGHRRDWHGPPATGELEYHFDGATAGCEPALFVVYSFAPTFRPGYTWAITSHRHQRGDGSWNTMSTDTVGFNPGKGPPIR